MDFRYGMLRSMMLLYLLGGRPDARMTMTPDRWMLTGLKVKKS